jgi:hypothetical protein
MRVISIKHSNRKRVYTLANLYLADREFFHVILDERNRTDIWAILS